MRGASLAAGARRLCWTERCAYRASTASAYFDQTLIPLDYDAIIPAGLRAFGQTHATATASKVLAANQGLYNGFLAAGLFWSLTQGAEGFHTAIFFLTCVAIAGIFGAITANRKILFVQTVPAVIALVLVHFPQ